jgi:hypothetical protein
MLQAIPMLSETPFFFLVLWMEPRALHRPGKHCSTEPHPWPCPYSSGDQGTHSPESGGVCGMVISKILCAAEHRRALPWHSAFMCASFSKAFSFLPKMASDSPPHMAVRGSLCVVE